jgi:hypothetical protein
VREGKVRRRGAAAPSPSLFCDVTVLGARRGGEQGKNLNCSHIVTRQPYREASRTALATMAGARPANASTVAALTEQFPVGSSYTACCSAAPP